MKTFVKIFLLIVLLIVIVASVFAAPTTRLTIIKTDAVQHTGACTINVISNNH